MCTAHIRVTRIGTEWEINWSMGLRKPFRRRFEYTLLAFGTYLDFHVVFHMLKYFRDTVSSVGITRRKSFPLTREVGHICFFRHALALDERRVKFLPEYVRGGAGPPRETTAKEATTDKKHKTNTGTLGAPQSNKLEQSGDIGRKVPAQQPTKVTAKLRVKEVWFPGNHSDM